MEIWSDRHSRSSSEHNQMYLIVTVTKVVPTVWLWSSVDSDNVTELVRCWTLQLLWFRSEWIESDRPSVCFSGHVWWWRWSPRKDEEVSWENDPDSLSDAGEDQSELLSDGVNRKLQLFWSLALVWTSSLFLRVQRWWMFSCRRNQQNLHLQIKYAQQHLICSHTLLSVGGGGLSPAGVAEWSS